MEQPIKISVLIPAYNVEAYIDQCLESVMNQTLREIEIIICDDCSTDSTLTHIEAAAEKDPRVRVIRHETNLSLFQSRKDAVLASSGEYIMFVDADDWLELNACELAYAKAKETGVDLLQFGAIVENCGNLPRNVVDNAQKEHIPYVGPALTELLVTACFERKAFGNYLWARLFRGELARKTYAEIEDGCYYFTEDIFQTFFLLLNCRTYLGMESRLYHYCYGRGLCGKLFLPLETFRRYCRCADVWFAIERYVTEWESKASAEEKEDTQLRAARAAAETLKPRLIRMLAYMWLNKVKKEEQPAAYLAMESTWKEAGCSNYAGLLAQYGWDKRKQIAEALAGAEYLRFHNRPIKTIALYYWKVRNGGAQRVVAILGNQLAELRDENGQPRYKVVLITEEEPQAEDYPVSPLVIREQIPPFMSSTGENYAPRAEAWARIVEKHQIDAVLYSQWMNPYLLGDLLSIKRTARNPAFVIHTHNWCASQYAYRDDSLAERMKVYRLADGVVTLSDADRLYWSRVNPNTRYIPNPCFVKASEAKRASFGKHILWLARIDGQKQPLEIPHIMREVVARDPDIVCHVVGAFDEKLMQKLTDEVAAEGLSKNVVLEGFQANVVPYYERCSLFLMTSRFEGFPLTLYEAASCALPTVMYDLPWLAYNNMMDGFVSVPQLDAEAAAEAIVRILNDPVEWQQRSDALYRSALEYEKTDVTAYWTALLDDLETGRLPEGPALDGTTRLFLDQISYFHGEAVRGLIGERDNKQKRVTQLERQLNTAREAEKKAREAEKKARESEKKAQESEKNAKEELNRVRGSLAFRLGTLIATPWRMVRDAVKRRLGRA